MFNPPDVRSNWPSVAFYSLTPDLTAGQVGVPRQVGWLLCSSAAHFLMPPLACVLSSSSDPCPTEAPVASGYGAVLEEIRGSCSCTEGQGHRSPVPLFVSSEISVNSKCVLAVVPDQHLHTKAPIPLVRLGTCVTCPSTCGEM